MTLEEVVLSYITAHPRAGRDEIRRFAAPEASETTIWRALRRLVDQNQLTVTGRGRATRYSLAGTAVVRAHLRIPYTRRSPVGYKKEFIDRYIPNRTFYLTQADRARLHEHGTPVGEPVPAATHARRILERLLIDLSWASSRMEGNTYNILETERLVRFGEEVAGKDRREAVMILNHKEAIQYVVEHLDEITISTVDIRNIHALLSDGLLIDPAMAGRVRRMPVNIGASTYRPLEDPIGCACCRG